MLRCAILSGSTGGIGSETARVIRIIFKPVKWALLALKVSGTLLPRHLDSSFVRASCVDGPRLARGHWACSAEVACSHVCGMLVHSGWTAGLDGVREPSRWPPLGKRSLGVQRRGRLQSC